MPKNKNALARYQIINQLLLNGKPATLLQMVEACSEKLGIGISRRTIENDLFAMRRDEALGYFAPIEYIHSRLAYIYTDPDYSIDRISVDDSDVQKLRLAATLLKQYGKVKQFDDFSGVIEKVVRLINYRKIQQPGKAIDFVEFEKNPTIQGMEHLDQLIQAIRQQEVISIKHHSFRRDEARQFVVHPYYLKEYKNRWYLLGFSETHNQIRIFGLERILEIETQLLKTFLSRPFDPEAWFEKFIGMKIPEGEPLKIVLRFKHNTGKYILTQPLHKSQKLLGQLLDVHDFEYLLAVNEELLSFILSWREHVEVLEPQSLRSRVKAILQAALRSY